MKNEHQYKILFSIDPLESELKPSPSALSWLREWTAERNAVIEVVYILSDPKKISPQQKAEVTDFELEGYVKNLNLPGEVKSKVVVEPSRSRRKSVETLIEHAKSVQADVIMVSSHGRSGVGRLVMGSFAESLLALSPLPVLFLNQVNQTPPSNKVLFPTDFSEASKAALDLFLDRMSGYSGEVVLFNAVPPPGAIYDTGYLGIPIYLPENYWIDMKAWVNRESEAMVKKVQAKGIKARIIVQNGVFNTPDSIQKCAENEKVGWVAMASASRGLDLAIMGSVAKEIFRLGKWPVWVCGPEVVCQSLKRENAEKVCSSTASKVITSIALVIVSSLLSVGCATESDRVLDQKIAAEPQIANTTELSKDVQSSIAQDSKLTQEQKDKLAALRVKTEDELKKLRQQSLRLRLVLVQDFETQNDLETDLVHDRIISNNNQQVSLIFDALKQANQIIGHTPHDRKWMMQMFNEEREHY